jgi:hypothetical protein
VRLALRRVAQFYRAMVARVRADEHDRIRERLAPAQVALFERMPRSDRRHCLDVYYTLVRAGYDQQDLLCAALLHDVGKAAPAGDGPAGSAGQPAGSVSRRGGAWRMTIVHRVAIVLLQGFTPMGPRWLARLAADGRGWKAPFAVHARHAQAGAGWAAEAGCSPAVVALIREHHNSSPDRVEGLEHLAALQWADGQN